MVEAPQRIRRFITLLVIAFTIGGAILFNADMWQPNKALDTQAKPASGDAAELLSTIPIKGRASKTGYKRTEYGNGWATTMGCDTRNIILHRDMKNSVVDSECKVLSGTLDDPYTGRIIEFARGADSSGDVQIDHVVALSDSWQKGAQQLTKERRQQLANDPLELLAVEGKANQDKGDGDAATWLPPNKLFRCQYVARQIAVKAKYVLWMTQAEHDTIKRILETCPGQSLPES